MTNFNELTNIQIKNWLIKNRVCIVTNSTTLPGSLYLASLKTYIDYVPQNNYMCINGLTDDGNNFYGIDAFLKMLNYNLNNNKFNYIIYIDEDCFIKNFKELLYEFEKFINGNYCLAGPQDGGVICHRNHSKLLINTFISFWNLKSLRQNKVYFCNYINESLADKNNINLFSKFKKLLLETSVELNNTIYTLADNQINKSKLYRDSNYKEEVPYCETVRNDINNPIEPHQIPYSFDDDTAERNYEPYYIIEQALILSTKQPLYYLHTNDLYEKDNDLIDNSGMTSVVMNSDTNEHILYHTWFSRAYDVYSKNPICINHTARINKIIKSV